MSPGGGAPLAVLEVAPLFGRGRLHVDDLGLAHAARIVDHLEEVIGVLLRLQYELHVVLGSAGAELELAPQVHPGLHARHAADDLVDALDRVLDAFVDRRVVDETADRALPFVDLLGDRSDVVEGAVHGVERLAQRLHALLEILLVLTGDDLLQVLGRDPQRRGDGARVGGDGVDVVVLAAGDGGQVLGEAPRCCPGCDRASRRSRRCPSIPPRARCARRRPSPARRATICSSGAGCLRRPGDHLLQRLGHGAHLGDDRVDARRAR